MQDFHMQEKMRQAAGGVQNYAFGATLSVAEFMITEDLERFIRNHPKSHIRMEAGKWMKKGSSRSNLGIRWK